MRQPALPHRPLTTKTAKITKKWQYDHVYRHGSRLRANGFNFIFTLNELGCHRLGISISGVKSAVKRNRLKRLIREYFRLNPAFPAKIALLDEGGAGIDLVITATKRFNPADLNDLQGIFSSFLSSKSNCTVALSRQKREIIT
ncbi:Ribonuclease P protein component [hydrothermal vent metagenome]|uniref:Ribonuclease P protein component n=1 Tax=hydrothermal vent metagenome TaxID=652676 RepID=A0A3B0VH66_9ZZZZ